MRQVQNFRNDIRMIAHAADHDPLQPERVRRQVSRHANQRRVDGRNQSELEIVVVDVFVMPAKGVLDPGQVSAECQEDRCFRDVDLISRGNRKALTRRRVADHDHAISLDIR